MPNPYVPPKSPDTVRRQINIAVRLQILSATWFAIQQVYRNVLELYISVDRLGCWDFRPIIHSLPLRLIFSISIVAFYGFFSRWKWIQLAVMAHFLITMILTLQTIALSFPPLPPLHIAAWLLVPSFVLLAAVFLFRSPMAKQVYSIRVP